MSGKFHKLALNESFERVAKVSKERAEFNRLMALSNGSNPMDNAPMLKPCPFCGEAVQHRFALHVSDGNTDDIIHAAPTDCGLQFFSVGSADHGATVAAAWNTRKHDPSALVEALKALIPTNVGDNRNIPDDFNLPCDISMGELRQARAALAAWEASQ